MTIRAGGERLAHPATAAGTPAGVSAGEREEGGRPRRPLLRWPVLRWAGLVWLGAFLVLLANDPGRMFFETKLSVDLDPVGFYASLWHLMDPRNTFGALNNQAIGYAMPMGPFYLAGQLAHVPVWLTERLWLSLIIAVGFAGLVKLAEALDIGSPVSRLLAGLVFALWPTFTIVIGSTSSAALPGMLAPWAVLPLTTAVRGPASAIRGSVIRAAARSGVVVLCMSGVNATVTLEALLLPGLFILTYARGRRLVWLALCWGAAGIGDGHRVVGPAAAAAGQVRVQLPALRGAGVHHHGHRVGRRRAARRRQLDRLPQPRHAVAARGLGHGQHSDGDHRRRDRGRVRPVRAGAAEHAGGDLAPAVRGPRGGRRAGRLRPGARRPV
jgi:hypothetical protein